MKQHFINNRWLDRLQWLNHQLKHKQVTQAPVATPTGVLFTACGNVCGSEPQKQAAVMANKYVDVPWTPFKQITDQTTVPSKCNSYKV